MLRERRRLQLSQRLQRLLARAPVRILHRRLAHGTIGVLEAQSLDAGVLRERRRLQLSQRLQRPLARAPVRILEILEADALRAPGSASIAPPSPRSFKRKRPNTRCQLLLR